MDPLHYDVILEAMKALFLMCLPIVLALALAGTLVSAFQSVTGLTDPASAYAVRLITLVLVLYFFFSAMSQTILNLAGMVFG